MDWNNIEVGLTPWIRVIAIEKGKFPNISLSYLFTTCFHCADPPCLKACPVGAIIKGKGDGIVIVDKQVCLGGKRCKSVCQKACPYDAPQFGSEPNTKMHKCNLCIDRWPEKKKPVCVESCPMRALDAGPLNEIIEKYGYTVEAEGFIRSKKAVPSVIFKPKLKRG